MWIAAAALVLSLVASTCSSEGTGTPVSPGAASSSIATPPVPPAPEPDPPVFAPAPDRRIPTDPGKLADELVTVTEALKDSIDGWTAHGDPPSGPPPSDLVLQALYQQRIYGTLARNDELLGRSLDRLPRKLRGPARANAAAGAKLLSLVSPIGTPSAFRTARPEPAGQLIEWFREAEDRFGMDWELLAAVMYVESKFGRVRSASTAGAQGPMQFIPATWAVYGLGGDIHDPHDAILGAANYLHASGAPGDERKALYAYNRSWAYVDAIQLYAGQIRKDPRNYYAYYNWQVFVLTTDGPVRLTGSGL